jgi:hypothetical protein
MTGDSDLAIHLGGICDLSGAGGVNTMTGPTVCFCCKFLALLDISPIIPIVTIIEKIKAIIDGITSMTHIPEFIL